jgi:signal transduction histidine kinase
VLFNLIDNAVKFTSRRAVQLRLRALADGATLRVQVADTGPGILADQWQRLFQDFERLDPTSKVAGSGLGLALSARLGALMGGKSSASKSGALKRGYSRLVQFPG